MATAAAQQQQQQHEAAPAPPGVPGPIYIDTQHEDFVHDAQMDYYGAKLATCSSDRTVKVYNVFDSNYELAATLQGHEGPVWQVSWAHPQFGVLLASCSFDGSVVVHRESRPGEWSVLQAFRHLHESSVNSVAFGPRERGLALAAASSDGRVSILTHRPNHGWDIDYITDCHPTGVNAVAWAPHGAYSGVGSGDDSSPAGDDGLASLQPCDAPRLVTGGCDNAVRFWRRRSSDNSWEPDPSTVSSVLTHTDWVRDVAWAPNLLPNRNLVASASEDGKVLLWQQDESSDGSGTSGEWTAKLLHQFDAPVWRVSWSVTGHLLAVSAGDSNVTLWKEGLTGQWSQVGTVPPAEAPAATAPPPAQG